MTAGASTRADLVAAGVSTVPPLARVAALASPALLTGLYVFSVTTLPTVASAVRVASSPGGAPTRVWLACALGATTPAWLLAAAWATATQRQSLARALGVWAFLGATTLAWLLHPSASEVGRLDPWRGWFGAIGLSLYALAWGVPDAWRRARPEDDPRTEIVAGLEPRERLPRGALVALAVALASAGALFALAFRVADAHRGVLGQSLAALAAVALVSAAARHAARSTPRAPASPTLRLSRASRAVLLLVLLLAAALVRLALGA